MHLTTLFSGYIADVKYSGKAHHHVAVPIPHHKKPLAHNPGKALFSFRNLTQKN